MVLPAVLFAFAAWVSYRNFETGDRRAHRPLARHPARARAQGASDRRSAPSPRSTKSCAACRTLTSGQRSARCTHRLASGSSRLYRSLQGIVVIRPQRSPAGLGQAAAGTDRSQFLRPRLLQGAGYRTTPAPMSARAQAAHGRHRRLFLLDVAAPAVGGWEVQRRHLDCGAAELFRRFLRRAWPRAEGGYFGMARADGDFLARYPVPEEPRAQARRAAANCAVASPRGSTASIYCGRLAARSRRPAHRLSQAHRLPGLRARRRGKIGDRSTNGSLI